MLSLLRERLTNEEIAARLGITLDGAKYHVSEILGKLGVATREEAAAWRPPERRTWVRAALSLPVAARIAGAISIAAATGGLGVLVWAAVVTGGPAREGNHDNLPQPNASPTLTRDQALLAAAAGIGRDTAIEGGLTTWAAARELTGESGGSGPGEPAAGAPVWLFRFRGMFTLGSAGFAGPPPPLTGASPAPLTPSCQDLTVYFPDQPAPAGFAEGRTLGPASGACLTGAPLTRDIALVLAAGEAWPWQDKPVMANVERMTLAEALARLPVTNPEILNPHPAPPNANIDRPLDTPVWLVTLTAHFGQPEGSSPPGGTPRPTTVVSCGTNYVIIADDTGDTLVSRFARASCP